jgi:hypothetical protein
MARGSDFALVGLKLGPRDTKRAHGLPRCASKSLIVGNVPPYRAETVRPALARRFDVLGDAASPDGDRRLARRPGRMTALRRVADAAAACKAASQTEKLRFTGALQSANQFLLTCRRWRAAWKCW